MGNALAIRVPEGEILLVAAVRRAGTKAGECEFLAILRMAFRTVTIDSLVPGTGPTCTHRRTGRQPLIRGI